MTKRIIRTIEVLLVICALSLVPTTEATAIESVPATSHCAVEAAPADVAAPMSEPVCFDTAQERDAYLESISASDAARSVAATVLIGIVYKDVNAGGTSLAFYGSNGCAGATFPFPSLASGWDNSISSVRAMNGCWVTLYTATSYGGNRLNCTPYCSSIASWNDNVKSLIFRPSGTYGRP